MSLEAQFNSEFQYKIIKLFLTNYKFAMEFGSLIKEEYFETKPLSILFSLGKRIVYRYEKVVFEQDLVVELEEYITTKGLQDSIRAIMKAEIKAIYKVYVENESFIIDHLVKFARRQEMKKALLSGAEILENDGSYESVVDLVTKAVSIGYGQNDGMVFDDLYSLPKLYKDMYHTDKLVKTGFKSYDKALGGGFAPGELHVLVAPPKCWLGDTKIVLLDGTNPTFKELYDSGKTEFWVYSCKEDGTIVPGKADNLQITKYVTEIVEVVLDNDRILRCTPDHRFMLRDGSYKEAQYLTKDDSLMPFYSSYSTDFMAGRLLIKDNKSGKEEFAHRLVMKALYGGYPSGKTHIHHINRNELDNRPENLVFLTPEEHQEEHRPEASARMNEQWAEPDSALRIGHFEELTARNKHRWANDQEYRQQMEEILRENSERIKEDPRRQEWCSKGGVVTSSKLGHGDKMRGILKELRQDPDWVKAQAEASSEVMNRNWSNPDFVKKASVIASTTMKKTNEWLQKDPEHKAKMRDKVYDNPEVKKKVSTCMKENFKNPEYVRNLKHKNCLRVVKVLQEKGLEVSKETYEAERKLGGRTKYNGCGSWETYLQTHPKYNHKAKSVRIVQLDKPEPVYDITVDKYNNFALEAGVFVHNSGKSTIGANIGAFVASVGKTVFHITLEISALDIMSKYATKLSNLTYDEVIESVEGSSYHAKLDRFKSFNPKLFVNYWTEKSVNTFAIRAWISKICSKYDVKPDLIIIDYDDLLLPSNSSVGKKEEDMYNDAGQIYTDLKGLADFFSSPILTFAQPQRQAWHKPNNNELITASDLAHSARKAHKAWSISSLNFADDKDVGLLYMDMVRRGKSHTKIKLARDLARGRIYEPEIND